MSRLIHSVDGQIRQMQMSKTQFFAFVEGTDVDGFVHGTNCDISLGPLQIQYEIVPASRLPGGSSGGKTKLIEFYNELASRGALAGNLRGRVTVAVFFLDKDLDDRKGKLISSDHVIYTDFYDVENHVFDQGSISFAVAAACSLPPNWCRSEFEGAENWQEKVARHWIDWVRFCYAANMLKLPGEANFGRLSPFHAPEKRHMPPDATEVARAEARVLGAAAAKYGVLNIEWESAKAEVDESYSAGRWNEIFKGKWYAFILESQIVSRSPNNFDKKHLRATLLKQVAGTMKFDGTWAVATQKKIRDLISSIGLSGAITNDRGTS